MSQINIDLNPFSLFLYEQVTNFSIHQIYQTMLVSTTANLHIVDLYLNKILLSLDYQKKFLSYFQEFRMPNVKVNSIVSCDTNDLWAILFNESVIVFFTHNLSYSVPIMFDYAICDIFLDQVHDHLIALKKDRKTIKVWSYLLFKEHVKQEKKISASEFDPKLREKGFECAFQVLTTTYQTVPTFKNAIIFYDCAEIGLLALSFDSGDVMILNNKFDIEDIITFPPNKKISVISSCKELLFMCDGSRYKIYNLLLKEQIKIGTIDINILMPIGLLTSFCGEHGCFAIISHDNEIFYFNYNLEKFIEKKAIIKERKQESRNKLIRRIADRIQISNKIAKSPNKNILSVEGRDFLTCNNKFLINRNVFGSINVYCNLSGTIAKIIFSSPFQNTLQLDANLELLNEHHPMIYYNKAYKCTSQPTNTFLMWNKSKFAILKYIANFDKCYLEKEENFSTINLNQLWQNSIDKKKNLFFELSEAQIYQVCWNYIIAVKENIICALHLESNIKIIKEFKEDTTFTYFYTFPAIQCNANSDSDAGIIFCCFENNALVLAVDPFKYKLERLLHIFSEGHILSINQDLEKKLYIISSKFGNIQVLNSNFQLILKENLSWNYCTRMAAQQFAPNLGYIYGFSTGILERVSLHFDNFGKIEAKHSYYAWHESEILLITWHPSLLGVFVSHCIKNVICLWNINSGRPLKVFTIAFHPKKIWIASSSNSLYDIYIIKDNNMMCQLAPLSGYKLNLKKFLKNKELIHQLLQTRFKIHHKLAIKKSDKPITTVLAMLSSQSTGTRSNFMSLFYSTEKFNNSSRIEADIWNSVKKKKSPENEYNILDKSLSYILKFNSFGDAIAGINKKNSKKEATLHYSDSFMSLTKEIEESKKEKKKKEQIYIMSEYLDDHYEGERIVHLEWEFLKERFDLTDIDQNRFEYFRSLHCKIIEQRKKNKEKKKKINLINDEVLTVNKNKSFQVLKTEMDENLFSRNKDLYSSIKMPPAEKKGLIKNNTKPKAEIMIPLFFFSTKTPNHNSKLKNKIIPSENTSFSRCGQQDNFEVVSNEPPTIKSIKDKHKKIIYPKSQEKNKHFQGRVDHTVSIHESYIAGILKDSDSSKDDAIKMHLGLYQRILKLIEKQKNVLVYQILKSNQLQLDENLKFLQKNSTQQETQIDNQNQFILKMLNCMLKNQKQSIIPDADLNYFLYLIHDRIHLFETYQKENRLAMNSNKFIKSFDSKNYDCDFTTFFEKEASMNKINLTQSSIKNNEECQSNKYDLRKNQDTFSTKEESTCHTNQNRRLKEISHFEPNLNAAQASPQKSFDTKTSQFKLQHMLDSMSSQKDSSNKFHETQKVSTFFINCNNCLDKLEKNLEKQEFQKQLLKSIYHNNTGIPKVGFRVQKLNSDCSYSSLKNVHFISIKDRKKNKSLLGDSFATLNENFSLKTVVSDFTTLATNNQQILESDYSVPKLVSPNFKSQIPLKIPNIIIEDKNNIKEQLHIDDCVSNSNKHKVEVPKRVAQIIQSNESKIKRKNDKQAGKMLLMVSKKAGTKIDPMQFKKKFSKINLSLSKEKSHNQKNSYNFSKPQDLSNHKKLSQSFADSSSKYVPIQKNKIDSRSRTHSKQKKKKLKTTSNKLNSTLEKIYSSQSHQLAFFMTVVEVWYIIRQESSVDFQEVEHFFKDNLKELIMQNDVEVAETRFPLKSHSGQKLSYIDITEEDMYSYKLLFTAPNDHDMRKKIFEFQEKLFDKILKISQNPILLSNDNDDLANYTKTLEKFIKKIIDFRKKFDLIIPEEFDLNKIELQNKQNDLMEENQIELSKDLTENYYQQIFETRKKKLAISKKEAIDQLIISLSNNQQKLNQIKFNTYTYTYIYYLF